MKKILLAVTLAMFVGCASNPSGAEQVLLDAGYTSITIEGLAPLSCGKEDFYRTSFTAIGPTGRPVSGAVCAGLFFKGATIRF